MLNVLVYNQDKDRDQIIHDVLASKNFLPVFCDSLEKLEKKLDDDSSCCLAIAAIPNPGPRRDEWIERLNPAAARVPFILLVDDIFESLPLSPDMAEGQPRVSLMAQAFSLDELNTKIEFLAPSIAYK